MTFQSNKAEAWSFNTFSQTTSCLCLSLIGLQVPAELATHFFIFYISVYLPLPLGHSPVTDTLSVFLIIIALHFRIDKGSRYDLGSLGRYLSFTYSCDFVQNYLLESALLNGQDLTDWVQSLFDCPGLRQVEWNYPHQSLSEGILLNLLDNKLILNETLPWQIGLLCHERVIIEQWEKAERIELWLRNK